MCIAVPATRARLFFQLIWIIEKVNVVPGLWKTKNCVVGRTVLRPPQLTSGAAFSFSRTHSQKGHSPGGVVFGKNPVCGTDVYTMCTFCSLTRFEINEHGCVINSFGSGMKETETEPHLFFSCTFFLFQVGSLPFGMRRDWFDNNYFWNLVEDDNNKYLINVCCQRHHIFCRLIYCWFLEVKF